MKFLNKIFDKDIVFKLDELIDIINYIQHLELQISDLEVKLICAEEAHRAALENKQTL